jgi:hypothetical protein
MILGQKLVKGSDSAKVPIKVTFFDKRGASLGQIDTFVEWVALRLKYPLNAAYAEMHHKNQRKSALLYRADLVTQGVRPRGPEALGSNALLKQRVSKTPAIEIESTGGIKLVRNGDMIKVVLRNIPATHKKLTVTFDAGFKSVKKIAIPPSTSRGDREVYVPVDLFKLDSKHDSTTVSFQIDRFMREPLVMSRPIQLHWWNPKDGKSNADPFTQRIEQILPGQIVKAQNGHVVLQSGLEIHEPRSKQVPSSVPSGPGPAAVARNAGTAGSLPRSKWLAAHASTAIPDRQSRPFRYVQGNNGYMNEIAYDGAVGINSPHAAPGYRNLKVKIPQSSQAAFMDTDPSGSRTDLSPRQATPPGSPGAESDQFMTPTGSFRSSSSYASLSSPGSPTSRPGTPRSPVDQSTLIANNRQPNINADKPASVGPVPPAGTTQLYDSITGQPSDFVLTNTKQPSYYQQAKASLSSFANRFTGN